MLKSKWEFRKLCFPFVLLLPGSLFIVIIIMIRYLHTKLSSPALDEAKEKETPTHSRSRLRG